MLLYDSVSTTQCCPAIQGFDPLCMAISQFYNPFYQQEGKMHCDFLAGQDKLRDRLATQFFSLFRLTVRFVIFATKSAVF